MCWNVLNINTYTYLWCVGNLYKHMSTIVSWFATNEQQINVVIQCGVLTAHRAWTPWMASVFQTDLFQFVSSVCWMPFCRPAFLAFNQSINQSIRKRSSKLSLETGLHSTKNTYPMSVNLPYGPCRKIAIELKINSRLTDIHVMKTNSNQACVH